MNSFTLMRCSAGAGALALAACQPSLHSDLPVGASAYSTIAVPSDVALAKLYTLEPGDEISINVFQEPDLSTERLVVDEAGNASLPLIGQVQVAGLSVAELAAEIERAYSARFLRAPNVNVILLAGAPRTVTVDGEVEDPGIYPVQAGYTLMSAVAMAGSTTDTAKDSEVLIFREVDGQRMGGRFNITDIRAGRMPDPQIVPGDLVVVGNSAIRSLYQDFLKTAPIIGAFARY